MNTKQFNTKLNGVLTSAKNMAANVQTLIEYAVDQAGAHGNLTELTALLVKTKGSKAINSRLLEAFCLAQVSNIEWHTKKDKKDDKITVLRQVKGETMAVTALSVSWVNYEADKKAPTVATKLSNVSTDAAKVKADAYRAKVKLTTDKAILSAHWLLLDQQMEMINNQLKAIAPIAVDTIAA